MLYGTLSDLRNAVNPPPGEAAVVAAEALPHLEAVANVTGDEERRALGQLPGVAGGLAEGPFHVAVMASRAPGVG